jgi:membrane protein required for colicin V production
MAVLTTVIGIVACRWCLVVAWRGRREVIALVAWVMAFMAALEFGAEVGQNAVFGIADPALRVLGRLCAGLCRGAGAMALVRLAVRSMVKALGLSRSIACWACSSAWRAVC